MKQWKFGYKPEKLNTAPKKQKSTSSQKVNAQLRKESFKLSKERNKNREKYITLQEQKTANNKLKLENQKEYIGLKYADLQHRINRDNAKFKLQKQSLDYRKERDIQKDIKKQNDNIAKYKAKRKAYVADSFSRALESWKFKF